MSESDAKSRWRKIRVLANVSRAFRDRRGGDGKADEYRQRGRGFSGRAGLVSGFRARSCSQLGGDSDLGGCSPLGGKGEAEEKALNPNNFFDNLGLAPVEATRRSGARTSKTRASFLH